MNKDFEYKQMVFFNMSFDGKYAWFCNVFYNALCRLDLETNTITLEAMLPEGRGECSYGSVVYYKEKLILLPRNEDNILIYDLSSKKYTRVKVSSRYLDKKQTIVNLFVNGIVFENNLFILPGRYHAIIKLNLDTLSVTYYSEWYDDLKDYIKKEHMVTFADFSCFENTIILPFWQGNKIVQFHMDTCTYEIIEIGGKDCQYSSAIYDGVDYWLSDKNQKRIVKWNKESNKFLYFEQFPNDFRCRYGIRYLERIGDDLFIVPMCGNMILSMNLENMKMKSVFPLLLQPNEGMSSFILADNNFLGFSKYENKLYMYSVFDGLIYCLDLFEKSVKKMNSQLSVSMDMEDFRKKICSHISLRPGETLYEKSVYNLEMLLEKLKEN